MTAHRPTSGALIAALRVAHVELEAAFINYRFSPGPDTEAAVNEARRALIAAVADLDPAMEGAAA